MVCLRSLSCWSTKFWPCPEEVAVFWRFFSRIFLYMLPFILPWITCNSPVLLDEKHPYIIMKPPQNLTVGWYCAFWRQCHFFAKHLSLCSFRIFQLSFHPIRFPFPKTAYISFHKFRQTLICLWRVWFSVKTLFLVVLNESLYDIELCKWYPYLH